ncbi:uncharacterized protein LOC130444696 [Diorhabda sublineata]|uniref:uncharacterized protein LOC130444696 n=1 Tax=Diorhabda sublineata TaxID=1163346 RepID=UPI0024E0C3DD|nr:uncharacterized protein LOC130444696 [Diorhabda sublineata]
MISKCIIVLALVAHVALGRTTGTSAQNAVHESDTKHEGNSYISDFRYMYKVYQECAATDVMSCLKLKLITALDRAAKSYSELPLIEGIKFVKDPQDTSTSQEVKSEAEIEATLPRSLDEKENVLDDIISDRVSNFLSSHTLQIKLPSSSEVQEEGRGKKKKGNYGLLLLPLILGGALVPLALGALALLAGKALIVSKLALVLAGIIGLKKLLSGNSGGDNGHVEVYSAGHSGWGRSYNKEEAQNLAYQAYAPKTT